MQQHDELSPFFNHRLLNYLFLPVESFSLDSVIERKMTLPAGYFLNLRLLGVCHRIPSGNLHKNVAL